MNTFVLYERTQQPVPTWTLALALALALPLSSNVQALADFFYILAFCFSLSVYFLFHLIRF